MYAFTTISILNPTQHTERLGFDVPDSVYNGWRANPNNLSNKLGLAWWIWLNEIPYPQRFLTVNTGFTVTFADGHTMTMAYNVTPGVIQELAVNAVT